MKMPNEIWTIGHSRHSFAEFMGLLDACHIQALADVRRFPVSIRFPHFSQMELFKALNKSHVDYFPFPELGGRRRPRPNSPNTLWRNESFRGYADYMLTQPFQDGIQRLLEVASEKRTALLCAEAVWWHCHRALIADFLKTMGIRVTHIFSAEKVQEHPYTSAARIVEGRLTYAPEQTLELVPSGG